jgi:hypothetical protein
VKVECEVEEVMVENDRGGEQPGVRVKCSRCDHCTESFGTGERSITRCLMLLKSECPEGESNFYVQEK